MTLIKKTINWGGLLTVPEVQSAIIMTGSMETCRQTVAESPASCKQQEVD